MAGVSAAGAAGGYDGAMSQGFDPDGLRSRLGAVAAAECEGTLMGALAAGEAPGAAAALAGAAAGQGHGAALEQWARALGTGLGEGQLAFRLSVPADRDPLDRRIEALAAWVRGFLSGIGQAGGRLRSSGAQVGETLSDLDAIARGAAVTEGGSDAEERAYAELVEYVRLAVQTLFETLNPPPPDRRSRGKMQS